MKTKPAFMLLVLVLFPSSLFAQQTAGTPGNVYKVGHGVSAPVAIQSPAPKLTAEERKREQNAPYKGTVVLAAIIGDDGTVKATKVVRSVTPDLDAKAVDAVKAWKFKPAMKEGKPVAVQVNVEVNFHLY